jgi:hypothetical protein
MCVNQKAARAAGKIFNAAHDRTTMQSSHDEKRFYRQHDYAFGPCQMDAVRHNPH